MPDLIVSQKVDDFMRTTTAAQMRAVLGAIQLNGALGTPASGVATNLTGLPVSTGLTGAGTGVVAALAANVGSAGAFVTFNGNAGTPSALVGTNITGTAAGLTAGTASAVAVGGITGLGGGVDAALAQAANSANGFVTGSALSAYLPLAGGTLSGNLVFSDTGEGLSLNGGAVITGASGAIAITAGGTSKNIVLTAGTDGETTLNTTGDTPIRAVRTATTLNEMRFVCQNANGPGRFIVANQFNSLATTINSEIGGFYGRSNKIVGASLSSIGASSIIFRANEQWSSTVAGSRIEFTTTPNGSLGGVIGMTVGNDGSLLTLGSIACAGAAISTSTGVATPVGTTTRSSLRIPHGAAPTAPVDGDVWSTTTTLNFRLNGTTKSITMT